MFSLTSQFRIHPRDALRMSAGTSTTPRLSLSSRCPFQDAGNPDEQICEDVAAIQFVEHFVPTAWIKILSD
jgi:hypothetical protein